MKRYLLAIINAALVLLVVSCKPTIDVPKPSSGSANFNKYIAIGNSLTAGYADNGLYLEGQEAAYPNLLAAKMKAVGGGDFISPFFDEAHANGSGYLYLKSLEGGLPNIEKITTKLAFLNNDKFLLTKYLDPIQNLGVPGMRLDLAFLEPFSAVNNYFERLLPDTEVGKKSYFDYTTENEHTFFSFWLGNSDVLGYATGGGITTGLIDNLTSKTLFNTLYNNFINKLTENDQKGVIATIPDVTAIPFFTTLKISGILKTIQEKSLALGLSPSEIPQGIYISTKAGTRKADDNDLIVLTFPTDKLGVPDSQMIPYGLDPSNPIEDKYILDKVEVARVKDYVKSYNETIQAIASSKGLAIADVYSYLNEVRFGILVNGAEISSTFITGGAFSLDGIHLTPKGNALITNLFIEAINKQYNAKLSHVDVNKYRGVKFP